MKATRTRKAAKTTAKLRSLGNSKQVVSGGREGPRRARLRSTGDASKVVAGARSRGATGVGRRPG